MGRTFGGQESFQRPNALNGGFNEVLKAEDRKGVLVTNIVKFREWVNDMEFLEMPFIGRKYTWRSINSCNKLNQVFFNSQWNLVYPNLKLKGLSCS